jgi:hypothetical protein
MKHLVEALIFGIVCGFGLQLGVGYFIDGRWWSALAVITVSICGAAGGFIRWLDQEMNAPCLVLAAAFSFAAVFLPMI